MDNVAEEGLEKHLEEKQHPESGERKALQDILTTLIKFGWILPVLLYTHKQPAFFTLLEETVLIVFGYYIALEDWKNKLIHNTVLKKMFLAWVVVLSIQCFFSPNHALFSLIDGIIGFLVCGSVFITVYILSRKGLGGGDVKFMAVAGLYLGLYNAFPAMIIGTSLSAVFCVILLVMKKITKKSTLPLAPFLYIGILLTII